MVNQRSFGRRGNPRLQPRPAHAIEVEASAQATQPAPSGLAAAQPMPPPQTEIPSLDDELKAWKAARKWSARIPWRPLSLMASLCFGIASFALPDSVNAAVDWLLYALAAMSLYAGLAKRREKAGKSQ